MRSFALVSTLQRQSICITLLLMASLISGCTSLETLIAGPNLNDTKEKIGQLRKQAEIRVSLVKQANQFDAINSDEFQTAQNLYMAAKDSVDLWIKQVQDSLEQAKTIEHSAEFDLVVQNANNKSEQFFNYVDELQLAERGVATRGIGLAGIISVIQISVELIEAVQKIDSQKRFAWISELEALRWKDFDAI